MWHRAADLRFLLYGAPLLIGVSALVSQSTVGLHNILNPQPAVIARADGSRVELVIPPPVRAEYIVRRAAGGPPLMGRFETAADRVIFTPALPLPAGQEYHFECRAPGGPGGTQPFRLPAVRAPAPRVSMRPAGVPLPANALRFYLHFTQPMEQGVFLDRLRLLDDQEKEIPGPFRETELWSPDGARLTVWFHPGRQKTGVNLNLDEGPVMLPGRAYRLIVSGSWRSAAGIPIGDDVSLRWTAGPEDHAPPLADHVEIHPPAASTTSPLRVTFSEPLDPAMLATALQVRAVHDDSPVPGRAEAAPGGMAWTFHPHSPWAPGGYHLRILPELEDLAGNSFAKPFEVDLQAAPSAPVAARPLAFAIRAAEKAASGSPE